MALGATPRRILSVGVRGVLALLLLAFASVVIEQVCRWRIAREYPPIGRMIVLQGRRIQLRCIGAGTPTVVFEAGLDTLGFLSWSKVQTPVSTYTRACAYSRAGILWSSPRRKSFDGQDVAIDLEEALRAGGEQGPFVLVGHSLGAAYAVIFAHQFPSEVGGLVLVDPSHPDQIGRFEKVFGESEAPGVPVLAQAAAVLAPFGFARFSSSFNLPADVPPAVRTIAMAYVSTSCGAVVREEEAIPQTLLEMGRAKELGDMPLIVLTSVMADAPGDLQALGWTAKQAHDFQAELTSLHDDEASWSRRGRNLLVPASSHYIQYDQPEVLMNAVRQIIQDVRGSRQAPENPNGAN
jgi:pimeloyl-ACP methyl ester carboxylesterase